MKTTKQIVLKKKIQQLADDTRGANMVEYIILVGVVALIALAGYRVFGSAVDDAINAQSDSVGNINTTDGG
jgi:Flp pilus assembly pilin Flp